MQPFEFLIRSRPVSQQARRSRRKDAWKDFVRREAERSWGPVHVPADGPVCVTLMYLYDEVALDVDNIIKPIQDALVGLVFPDDSLVLQRDFPTEEVIHHSPTVVKEGRCRWAILESWRSTTHLHPWT